MKKFLAVIAAAFCILTVLNTAHTAGKDEAEKKEQVKICISMPVDIADALAEDFTKASGVETQVVPLPPGSAENRFNFLASSGSDVWLGGTAVPAAMCGSAERRRSFTLPLSAGF